MRSERRYNLLEGFDFSVLDDPEFKEDSVREDIVAPLLRGLGYDNKPPYKMVRSRYLKHPFVSIGTATKNIYLIPDYILEVDGRLAWTLDAKAPDEPIINSKHVEQAYSYAIHSEIRVPYFALCNGRQFVLYHISAPKPIFDFDMRALPSYWDNLKKLLAPADVLNYDHSLKKDFGLHLKRLGFDTFEHLIFPNVPITFVARLDENLYTFGSGLKTDDGGYVVTFDFDAAVAAQLKGRIPEKAMRILQAPMDGTKRKVIFTNALYRVNLDCRVGAKLEENEKEIFLPLRINQILS